MVRTGKLFMIVSIALLILSSEALAGGDDGAKRNSTIRVRNDYGFPIGVIVDADEDDLEDIAENSDDPIGDFEDLGGVVLNPGETATFGGLKAGSHDVVIVDGADFSNNATATISVDRGRTRTLSAVDNNGVIDFDD